MRTRATVAGLTSSAAPMAASVQPGPASPWLAFNRRRAWVSALAGATPRPIMVCSRARSCSDRTTTYRLRTSASCGGIPGRTSMRPNPRISQITTDDLLEAIERELVQGRRLNLRDAGILLGIMLDKAELLAAATGAARNGDVSPEQSLARLDTLLDVLEDRAEAGHGG